VPASKASSLFEKALQTDQHKLCPVVTGVDDLGVSQKGRGLLIAALVTREDSIREENASVHVAPSLAKA
jgi:hypothetical protein